MSPNLSSIRFYPSGLIDDLDRTIKKLNRDRVVSRMWAYDYTLWSDRPDEITNRLDWLNLPTSMVSDLEVLKNLTAEVLADGFETALLLGMGGSSLAPEVFRKIAGVREGYLDLHILDSTDPGAVLYYQNTLNLEKTLFIVSTKSGGTVETLSFMKYFYTLLMGMVGKKEAGRRFIAVTDPGSKLVPVVENLHFRQTFFNNPNLGGRYSALSFFGLVPAALIGIELESLLEAGQVAARQNDLNTSAEDSPGAQLGALIGTAAKKGRDKLTFISDDRAAPFSDWIEQLIAESTGKSGTGILPVVGEEVPDDLGVYGNDRIFVFQQFGASSTLDQISHELQTLGHPVVEYHLQDAADLGKYMFHWEFATAIAGYLMGIHPFNQPNVEAAKVRAIESVNTFQKSGKLPEREDKLLEFEVIDNLLSRAHPGEYVVLQAFVNPTAENASAFRQLQAAIRDRYGLATTFGFGPRFLHSTGQLHKGGQGTGNFLQFVSTSPTDLPVPENPGSQESFISFDVLKHAQALGDAAALEDTGRNVPTFSLETPVAEDIQALTRKLKP